MRSNWKSRSLAWMLATAMAVPGIPSAPVLAEEAQPAKLADFNFDAEAQDNAYTGGSAKGKINGNCQTMVKVGEDKALYLNGSDAFLTVMGADDSGLLAGKNEITISYDAKPEAGGKSWPFFAAPNADRQTYKQEHYLGVLHTTGNILVERYNNSGDRPGNNLEDATVGSDWTHVDIVVSEQNTALYINGEKKQEKESSYKLSEILGENGGTIQIGKANWDNGEYYKGYLDNVRIYDGVLPEAAIASQYAQFQEFLDKLQAGEKKTPLEKDYDALDILNPKDVRGNLALIKKGRNGSAIEWTSSKPDVITDSADAGSVYDGGIVKRPAAGSAAVDVTLTAVLSMQGEESKTKTFEVTVQPLTANLDKDYAAGYLWTNFGVEGGYEKIFFGYSKDGLNWNKLNKTDGVSMPILANDAIGSDLGVRDPHLIRSAEGDRYWILGTDLHAEGGGSGGSGWNQSSASKNLVVWESKDLVTWSAPRLVYAGFDNAGCVWAPEAIYDDATGDYVVYWSARDKSKVKTEEDALRVYVCRTRDFGTFTEPKVWLSEDLDSGDEVNIIDTTIVKSGGKFYRFSTSDWNTVVDVSDTLDTEDVFDVRKSETESKPNGSWKRLVKRSQSEAAGFDRREGFTVYQLPDGRWCAMGDNGGYKAFITDDLSKGTFATDSAAAFKDGKFRHGTVVRLSKAEEAKILEAFKEKVSGDVNQEEPAEKPVLTYDFEQDAQDGAILDSAEGNAAKENGKLFGNAEIVYDEERQSKVLKLDGSNGTYAEIPKGFFDKRNIMSISMDVKSELDSGNFFTFTFGKDSTYYDFLRVRGTAVRNGLTVTSWNSEQEVAGTGAPKDTWQRIVLVIDGTTMKLYIDGSLVSVNEDTGILMSALGKDLLAYFGKSFYGGDIYFKGSFDNFNVYNRALTDEEIAGEMLGKVPLLKSVSIGTVPENPSQTMGTDTHTAISSQINRESKEIVSYVKKGTDLSAVPVKIGTLLSEVRVTANGTDFTGGVLDLRSSVTIEASYGDQKETYTIKRPKIARNPVLPGQYADPDIDYFDGKYWIYPTTDGYSGWGGTVFHAWSSENLEDWEDEGVILDLKANTNEEAGLNAKGVQIAPVPWSTGNAWAPSIEKKDGKYYFYFCGHDKSTNAKAIGVAVADSPAGPFTVKDAPLVSITDCRDKEKISMGQAIDPSIFTDDDGTSYMSFGNGNAAIVELNEDMTSYKAGTMKNINGLNEFRESVVITKRKGIYHYTWSCDDTGSPNYKVNYGTSDSLNGKVTFQYTLLEKDESAGMLGTAHQSVIYHPDIDKAYIAYHRFYTPLGIYTSGYGYHRESCIDEITFDENGLMKKMVPTMEGVTLKDQSGEDQRILDEIMASAGFAALLPDRAIETEGKLNLPTDVDGAAIVWTTDTPSVIAADGTVTLPGKDTEVTLTAAVTYGIASASKDYKVTVKGNGKDDSKITKINETNIILGEKETFALSVVTSPKNAKVTWKSSSNSVASVSKKGLILARKPGKATISAILENGSKKTCKVTVKNAPTKVIVNPARKVLKKGQTFTIKVKFPKSTMASNKITYSSSSKSVAAVSASGEVLAKKRGTAVITVKTYNNKKAKVKVTVR